MKRIQRTLGVVQITLAFALLVGGAVLALSLNALLNQPLGFTPQHRIVTSVLLPQGSNDPTALIKAVRSVRALPSSVSVGGAGFWAYPFTENNYNSVVARTIPRAPRKLVREVAVTTGYFHGLGIAIRRGRRFDRAALIGTGRREILISPSLAHALFGTTDAVGQMANLSFDDYRIIGITAPVVWQATPTPGIHGVVYVPAVTMTKAYKLFPFTGATVLVHVRGSIPAAIAATQQAIEQAVPGAVVTEIRPYSAVIDTFVGFRIVIASLVAGFALLALIIATLGVYAVNTFIARARLPEFGMRAMLGASPAQLFRLALTDAAWLLGFGLAGGAIGGYVLIRAMSSQLFHPATIAPPVFAVSAVLIAAIVFGAAWRPAVRAAQLPVQTLLDAS
jgi:ABC-type antimicrobial peptide transport system permease subunit